MVLYVILPAASESSEFIFKDASAHSSARAYSFKRWGAENSHECQNSQDERDMFDHQVNSHCTILMISYHVYGDNISHGKDDGI